MSMASADAVVGFEHAPLVCRAQLGPTPTARLGSQLGAIQQQGSAALSGEMNIREVVGQTVALAPGAVVLNAGGAQLVC
jgi:hypothetical protein